ncbi:hypothetical protein DFH27DRAFT_609682 [Peziza echinospora]|nr:hypothetical protein DFH27DRAFT_609682 [Peziza echinospora]
MRPQFTFNLTHCTPPASYLLLLQLSSFPAERLKWNHSHTLPHPSSHPPNFPAPNAAHITGKHSGFNRVSRATTKALRPALGGDYLSTFGGWKWNAEDRKEWTEGWIIGKQLTSTNDKSGDATGTLNPRRWGGALTSLPPLGAGVATATPDHHPQHLLPDLNRHLHMRMGFCGGGQTMRDAVGIERREECENWDPMVPGPWLLCTGRCENCPSKDWVVSFAPGAPQWLLVAGSPLSPPSPPGWGGGHINAGPPPPLWLRQRHRATHHPAPQSIRGRHGQWEMILGLLGRQDGAFFAPFPSPAGTTRRIRVRLAGTTRWEHYLLPSPAATEDSNKEQEFDGHSPSLDTLDLLEPEPGLDSPHQSSQPISQESTPRTNCGVRWRKGPMRGATCACGWMIGLRQRKPASGEYDVHALQVHIRTPNPQAKAGRNRRLGSESSTITTSPRLPPPAVYPATPPCWHLTMWGAGVVGAGRREELMNRILSPPGGGPRSNQIGLLLGSGLVGLGVGLLPDPDVEADDPSLPLVAGGIAKPHTTITPPHQTIPHIIPGYRTTRHKGARFHSALLCGPSDLYIYTKGWEEQFQLVFPVLYPPCPEEIPLHITSTGAGNHLLLWKQPWNAEPSAQPQPPTTSIPHDMASPSPSGGGVMGGLGWNYSCWSLGALATLALAHTAAASTSKTPATTLAATTTSATATNHMGDVHGGPPPAPAPAQAIVIDGTKHPLPLPVLSAAPFTLGVWSEKCYHLLVSAPRSYRVKDGDSRVSVLSPATATDRSTPTPPFGGNLAGWVSFLLPRSFPPTSSSTSTGTSATPGNNNDEGGGGAPVLPGFWTSVVFSGPMVPWNQRGQAPIPRFQQEEQGGNSNTKVEMQVRWCFSNTNNHFILPSLRPAGDFLSFHRPPQNWLRWGWIGAARCGGPAILVFGCGWFFGLGWEEEEDSEEEEEESSEEEEEDSSDEEEISSDEEEHSSSEE